MSTQKTAGYKQLGAFLEDLVRKNGINAPIFYSDIAALFGFPPVTDAWYAHPLCNIFEQLDVEDAKLSRPLRTALVISHEHSRPGEGFYKTYLRLHPKARVPKTDQDKMKLFLKELDKLVKYYCPRPVKRPAFSKNPG